MFNVYTIVASYCDRDAISGWSAHRHPYTFLTEAGAIAVSRLLGDEIDPNYTVVVPVGASPFDQKAQIRRFSQAPTWGWTATDKRYDDAMDEIPF